MHGLSENDLEPYVTLRGHIGQIMSLTGSDGSSHASTVFSGSING